MEEKSMVEAMLERARAAQVVLESYTQSQVDTLLSPRNRFTCFKARQKVSCVNSSAVSGFPVRVRRKPYTVLACIL